jgi:hypothetical protein
MASGDVWLITSPLPVSGNTSGRHNQTNGCTAVGQSVQLGPQPGHYVGVRHLRPGSAPRLACRGNEHSAPNLHFWVYCTDTQVGRRAETVGQDHRDRKIPASEAGVA